MNETAANKTKARESAALTSRPFYLKYTADENEKNSTIIHSTAPKGTIFTKTRPAEAFRNRTSDWLIGWNSSQPGAAISLEDHAGWSIYLLKPRLLLVFLGKSKIQDYKNNQHINNLTNNIFQYLHVLTGKMSQNNVCSCNGNKT